jgi:hypothetical protein
MLLGGLDTAVGDLASAGINLLFGMHQSVTPQPTGEDLMVITDFDPREDVLFLPVPTSDQSNPGTTLSSTPTFYSESASGANGQTGWGIEFAKGRLQRHLRRGVPRPGLPRRLRHHRKQRVRLRLHPRRVRYVAGHR